MCSSDLVAVRPDLQAVVVEGLDVELVAAARAVRRVAIHGGRDAHLLALRGKPVRVEVVDADADVVHRARIRELVDAEEAVAQAQVDAAVARTAHDLRAETGVGSWRQPHEYQANEEIWAGEIGSYEGAYYVESARIYQGKTGATQSTTSTTTTAAAASGDTTLTLASTSNLYVGDRLTGTGLVTSTTTVTAISGSVVTIDTPVASGGVTSGATITITPVTKVFNTYFAGQQALAEAVAEEPHIVIGPVVDKLMRHRPIGRRSSTSISTMFGRRVITRARRTPGRLAT